MESDYFASRKLSQKGIGLLSLCKRRLGNGSSKVSTLFWRLHLNKVPMRVHLDKHGIDIGSVICPICDSNFEIINHLFFSCGMAMNLWNLLAKWLELDFPVFSSI